MQELTFFIPVIACGGRRDVDDHARQVRWIMSPLGFRGFLDSVEAVFSAFIGESDEKAIISGHRGQRRVEGSALLTHACYFEMWFHQVR